MGMSHSIAAEIILGSTKVEKNILAWLLIYFLVLSMFQINFCLEEILSTHLEIV